MENKGLSKKKVRFLLDYYLKKDLTYQSGKILGSMCTSPNNFAKQLFTEHLEKNLGDEGLFPGTLLIEKEAIKILGELLSNNQADGHILSGGTEANILAMWVARNSNKKDKPEIIVPSSSHFSFDKAANLLKLKIIKVKLNERYEVDVQAVKNEISKNTVAIIGMAGSTDLGVVDPISELSDIALSNNIYLHVDAAFGGFVIPFLREVGYNIPNFDFKFKGVSSITIDPHKMGLAPIPSGGILFRNENYLKKISIKVPYLSGGEIDNSTILGTRSGASVIAVLGLLKYMGKNKYKKIIQDCMQITKTLADEIKKIRNIKLMIDPVINIIGFTCLTMNNKKLEKKLREKGWATSLFPNHIRIVIMPHISESHIHKFLADLKSLL